MAIEPMGSIMSVQAQTFQPKQATPVKEDTAAPIVQEAAKIDKTINVIQEAQYKNNTNQNDAEQQQQAQNEQVKKAVEQLNKNMSHSEAIFGIHEGTNRVTIKIVDRGTKELIKELPPEKTLDMIAKVWEMAGILVDEKR